MRSFLPLLVLFAAVLPLSADTAALLVGNSRYPLGTTQLPEIRAEFPAVARSLRRSLKFEELEIRYDLDTREMNRTLETFISGAGDYDGLKGQDFGYLHFSGHGIIEGSQILLLPSDSKYHRDSGNMQLETVPLTRLFSMLKEHDEVPTLLVLDCCLEGKESEFKRSYLIESCPANVCLVAPVSIGEEAPAKSLLNEELLRCLDNPAFTTWQEVVVNLGNPGKKFSPLVINPEALAAVAKKESIDTNRSTGQAFAASLKDLNFDTTTAGTTLTNSIGQTLVFAPAGRCELGSPPDEKGRDNEEETVINRMIAIPYFIGSREISQAEWRKVFRTDLSDQAARAYRDDQIYVSMKTKSIREFLKAGEVSDLVLETSPDLPMCWVNYWEAREFCAELTRIEHERGFLPEGWEYGLPTEWEWEYACRSGQFSKFDHTSDLAERGWYLGNSFVDYKGTGLDPSLARTSVPDQKPRGPHGRGLKQPNSWGLSDCLGNVWELCEREEGDGYGPGFVPRRGGSWFAASEYCRPANRNTVESSFRFIDQGFRICLRKTGNTPE